MRSLPKQSVQFSRLRPETAPADNQSNSVQQPAQQTDDESITRFHKTTKPVKDQYIVVLQNDTSERDVKSLVHEFAFRYSGITQHIYTHAIKGFSMQMTEAAAIALSRDPQVALRGRGWQVELATTQTNPPSWGFDRIDQHDLPPMHNLQLQQCRHGRRRRGTAVFTFVVWAPGKAGSYNFQWRMLREGVEWFGPSTPNLVITVKNPPCLSC